MLPLRCRKPHMRSDNEIKTDSPSLKNNVIQFLFTLFAANVIIGIHPRKKKKKKLTIKNKWTSNNVLILCIKCVRICFFFEGNERWIYIKSELVSAVRRAGGYVFFSIQQMGEVILLIINGVCYFRQSVQTKAELMDVCFPAEGELYCIGSITKILQGWFIFW